MKKLLLAVPLISGLAGACWAGSTLYSGSESRDAYDRVIADLNETLGFAVVNTDYVAGFLKSEATTQVLLTDGLSSDALFTLHHEIEHSPVSTGTNAGLSAARITTTLVTQNNDNAPLTEALQGFGGEQPIMLLSRVGFDGTVNNEFTIAPFEFAYSSGTEVRSEAAVWNFVVDNTGAFAGSGHWGGAVVESPQVIVNLSQMNDTFNYTRHSTGLYQGSYEQSYAEVRLDVPDTGLGAAVSEVVMSMLSEVTQDNVSGDLILNINGIDAPIALDSAQFEMRVGGLGIEGIERINALESQILAADVSADATDTTDPQQLLKDYVNAFGALVKPGAYVGYELSLSNAGGTADSSITATFDGDDSTSGYDLLTSSSATRGDLLRAIKIEVSLNAPDAALALTPVGMFIDPAMLAPFIVANASGLTSNIVVDDLVADVNGEQMPLELMLGEQLTMPLNLDKLIESP